MESAFLQKNIDVYFDTKIEEVIGESMVKALKLSTPKVLSSQLVLIDSGLAPNRKLFAEDLKQTNNFFTNH